MDHAVGGATGADEETRTRAPSSGGGGGGYSYQNARRLEDSLTANYSTSFRPSKFTSVQIQLGLMHMKELNLVAEELIVGGVIMGQWTDERLTWEPSDYGIPEMTVFHNKIWTPTLLLSNAGDGIKVLNDDSRLASVVVRVYSNGSVVWLFPINFNAQCSVNTQFYPFDHQECVMKVSTWMFRENELKLMSHVNSINIDSYEENGEWDIMHTSVENSTLQLYSYTISALNYKLRLARRYSYYVINLILPVVILACMGPFVFILPVESGEKNGFALTIMLSLSVILDMVSAYIPRTANNTCFLSVYLLVTFFICSMETIVTTFTCRIHDHHSKGYKPGVRTQALIRGMAKITQYRRAMCDEHKSLVKISQVAPSDKMEAPDNGVDVKAPTIGKRNNTFTYEEFATILDRFNFGFFALLNCVVIFGFMFYLVNSFGSR